MEALSNYETILLALQNEDIEKITIEELIGKISLKNDSLDENMSIGGCDQFEDLSTSLHKPPSIEKVSMSESCNILSTNHSSFLASNRWITHAIVKMKW